MVEKKKVEQVLENSQDLFGGINYSVRSMDEALIDVKLFMT